MSSKSDVAHMAAQSTIKLAAVRQLLSGNMAAAAVAAHYGEPLAVARAQWAQAQDTAIQAGF